MKHHVSRRAILRLGAAATAGLAALPMLAACGGAAAPASTVAPAKGATAEAKPAAEPTKPVSQEAKPTAEAKPAAQTKGGHLNVWAWQSFTVDGDKLLATQAEEYGKANGLEVEYVAIENKVLPDKLAAAIEAKSPPDVQMINNYTTVFYYQAGGHLVELTDIYDEVSKLEGGFVETVEPVFRVDGKVWSVPFEVAAQPLNSRLDLIEKATGKREPPKTLDELAEVSRKILQPPDMHPIGLPLGKCPDGHREVLIQLWADGGSMIDEEGKPNFNSKETVFGLKRILDWWNEKLIPPNSPSADDTWNNNAYQNKTVAFTGNPPSVYFWLLQNDKELLDNTALAARPTGASGQGPDQMEAWSWSIFNLSKNQDAAKGLIRYFMEPSRLQSVYEAVGGRWYPIHMNLQKKEYWTSKPHFKYYPDMVTRVRSTNWPAKPTAKLFQALGEVTSQMLLGDVAQDLIVKGSSPEQAAEDGQKRIVEVFKKYGQA